MARPTGVVHRVSEILIRRIVSGTYSPGLRLPSEVDLAGEFECGRSTIREALGYLASLNLVRSRRGAGAVVLDYKREGRPELLVDYFLFGQHDHPLPVLLGEMLRIRALLACEAARLAALYATPESLEPVHRAIAATHAARHEPLEHSLGELEVYRLLTHASAVWPAAWFASAFLGPLREAHLVVANPLAAVPDDWLAVMQQLMGFIEARDAERAVAHLEAHFAEIDGRLAEGLQGLMATPELAERTHLAPER